MIEFGLFVKHRLMQKVVLTYICILSLAEIARRESERYKKPLSENK
jgi:hypothetical protein